MFVLYKVEACRDHRFKENSKRRILHKTWLKVVDRERNHGRAVKQNMRRDMNTGQTLQKNIRNVYMLSMCMCMYISTFVYIVNNFYVKIN